MKLYRSILLNENEELDLGNLGNSWTLCKHFAREHAEDINGALKKDGYVILSINVDLEDVDVDNSLFALETREDEVEIVVNNKQVEAEIYLSNIDSIEEFSKIQGNTGENDFEDYCDEYEGELTKDDLMEMIKDF